MPPSSRSNNNFLTAVSIEITIVWDVTPCNLVDTSTIVSEEFVASIFRTEKYILKV
jgi:hypothetical protein